MFGKILRIFKKDKSRIETKNVSCAIEKIKIKKVTIKTK